MFCFCCCCWVFFFGCCCFFSHILFTHFQFYEHTSQQQGIINASPPTLMDKEMKKQNKTKQNKNMLL